MFGILTGWVGEWVKMRYLNTTEDVLNWFQQNISTLPFPAQIFFWKMGCKGNSKHKSKGISIFLFILN
jgi:hypothetical protein